MSSELYRLTQRKKARQELKRIFDNAETTIIVHYASESLGKVEDGSSPRVSCISVKMLATGNSTSFSIHHFAERMGVPFEEIHDHYETLERKLLDSFFDFVRDHQGFIWGHWNMRSIIAGFAALEHRYSVLGGQPIVIPDNRKIDIARLIRDIYGPGYVGRPVLANLCKINNLDSDFFLEGSEEALAFDKGEFRVIHQSNLKKVDFISYIAQMALTGTLKTNAKWWKSSGVHPSVIVELVKSHWLIGVLGIVALAFGLVRGIMWLAS